MAKKGDPAAAGRAVQTEIHDLQSELCTEIFPRRVLGLSVTAMPGGPRDD
jgi:hypothetical protein